MESNDFEYKVFTWTGGHLEEQINEYARAGWRVVDPLMGYFNEIGQKRDIGMTFLLERPRVPQNIRRKQGQ